VYPVYWQIACQVGVSTSVFDSFPYFDPERVFSLASATGADVVLLPQPLKLHGRFWTEEEAAAAEAWLRRGPERRLILDGVYGFGLPLDAVASRLIATGQTLFLDSLSKGWLHQSVFGVAVVPMRDLAMYEPLFRRLAPSIPKLATARELLTRFRNVPERVVALASSRRAELVERVLPAHIVRLSVQHGYFLPVEKSAHDLLAESSLLTLPVTVFGSRLRSWSIASALPPIANAF
jgi:hypothetical protein